MKIKDNYTIVIVLLSITLLFIILLSLPSSPIKETKLKDFPKVIGQWQGEDQPIEEKVYKMLSKSDLLLKGYQNPKGDMILLFIVASSINPEAFHPPEVCFEGGGAQFLKKETPEIQVGKEKIKVNKLYIKRKDIEHLTLYWFRVGKRSTHNYYMQQVNMFFDQIMRKGSISALIRVVTIVKDGKTNEAFELEKSFIKEITPLLDKYLTH
ncbi:MAG: exosortase C-terminal domain/associated protein EpsI [bacterium]